MLVLSLSDSGPIQPFAKAVIKMNLKLLTSVTLFSVLLTLTSWSKIVWLTKTNSQSLVALSLLDLTVTLSGTSGRAVLH